MKLKTHPHKSDLLTLTKGDLDRIAAGETLQVSALVIELEKEPKPDVVLYRVIDLSFRPTNEAPNGFCSMGCWPERASNIKLTFDGETSKLKSAEVL